MTGPWAGDDDGSTASLRPAGKRCDTCRHAANGATVRHPWMPQRRSGRHRPSSSASPVAPDPARPPSRSGWLSWPAPATSALLKLDMYYRDLNDLPFGEREGAINYDHPRAFDWPLLMRHVDALAAGTPVDVPVYDFENFIRTDERAPCSARIVVVEGILVLAEPDLRERFDLCVYVDTDADVRFIRRLQRDLAERGRHAGERHQRNT